MPVEVLTTLADQAGNVLSVRLEGGETLAVNPLPIDTIVEAAAGNFVFRPGGVAGNGVFTTWATLAAAVALLDPALQKFISVDDSIAAAHVTTGTWPGFENCTFQSGGSDSANSSQATLIFDTGARLTGVEHIEFSAIQVSLTDATGTVIPATTASLVVACIGAAIQNAGGAAGLATIGAGFSLSYRGFASALGTSVFKGAATATYVLLLFSGSSLATNTVNGTAGGTVVVEGDGSSQAGIAGTTQTPAESTKVVLDPVATFVFRPGGVAGGNTFTTWASLMAAVALSPGTKTIEVDDSLASAHATVGTWNVDLCVLTVFFNTAGSGTLHLDAGCIFTWATLWITNGLIVSQDGNAPVTTQSSGFSALYVDGPGTTLQSSVAFPFLSISGGTCFLGLTGGNPVIGDGTHRVLSLTNAAATVSCSSEALIGTVKAHALFGTSGTFFALLNAGASFAVQADFSGTLTTTFEDKASQILYSPGTVGNWNPVPTLTSAALDQLAAPNTTQASNNTGTGTGVLSITSGNITKALSGKVLVTANVAGTSAQATTITLQLVRDAATNIGNPIVETTLSAGDGFHGSITFVDTLPDNAAHSYKMTATAGAGNLTAGGANSVQITAVEL